MELRFSDEKRIEIDGEGALKCSKAPRQGRPLWAPLGRCFNTGEQREQQGSPPPRLAPPG